MSASNCSDLADVMSNLSIDDTVEADAVAPVAPASTSPEPEKHVENPDCLKICGAYRNDVSSCSNKCAKAHIAAPAQGKSLICLHYANGNCRFMANPNACNFAHVNDVRGCRMDFWKSKRFVAAKVDAATKNAKAAHLKAKAEAKAVEEAKAAAKAAKPTAPKSLAQEVEQMVGLLEDNIPKYRELLAMGDAGPKRKAAIENALMALIALQENLKEAEATPQGAPAV